MTIEDLFPSLYSEEQKECADQIVKLLNGKSYRDAIIIMECVEEKLGINSKVVM